MKPQLNILWKWNGCERWFITITKNKPLTQDKAYFDSYVKH